MSTQTKPLICPECGNDMLFGSPNDIRTESPYFNKPVWYCAAKFKGIIRYEGGCGYTEETKG